MISATVQGLEEIFRFKVKASLTLEYLPAKAVSVCNEKNALLFSTLIASMANSNGGTIFIGIHASRKTPRTIEPIPNDDAISWLRMVCKTEIAPEIPDCIIEKIVVNEQGGYIIGIQVPNSHKAPHISGDKRFYRRSDTKTLLLEEYEIRDLYTKGKRPEIEFFSVTNNGGIPIMAGGKFQKINFYPRFLIKNIGNGVERFYKIELSVPSAINNPNFNTMSENFSRFEDGNTIYSFTGKNLLFQGEIASVVEPNFVVDELSYKAFDDGEITIRIFFSSGVQTKSFHCKELLLYRNKQIEFKDFSTTAIVTEEHKPLTF